MLTLSRYFYENVEFVANMCPRCYEECRDVKIISVNKEFLEQVHRKSSQNSKIPDWLSRSLRQVISQKFETNNEFLGFSPEEGQKSKMHSHMMQKNLKDMKADLRNLETHHLTPIECFEGFRSNDVKDSRLYHERVRKTCDLMRYKICKRISLSIIKNIKRMRLKPRSKTKTKEYKETAKNRKKIYSIAKENEREFGLERSKYFGNNVNFNNNLVEPSKSNKLCLVIEIGSNYNEDCANDNIFKHGIKREIFHNVSLKSIEEQKCGGIFDTELKPVDYESEYFRITENSTESIHIAEFSSKFIAGHSWIPPRSPHNLIEECLYQDPWALLAATIFLNKTSCMVARPFVFWFLVENPDPFKVLDKFPKDLEKYFCDLGLQKTRAVQVYRMSYDFLFKNWRRASDLYGIGNYGESAFRMFCLGDFSTEPKDRFLKIYKAWYQKLHLKR